MILVIPRVYAQWYYEDIGSPAMAGVTSASSPFKVFEMEGGGGNIGGASDQGHFAHSKQSGNFEFTAKLQTLETGTSVTAQAGVMVRQDPGNADIAADGPYALVSALAGGGVRFSYRQAATETAVNVDVPSVTVPVWLRLKKEGSNYIGSYSTDGNVWTQIAQQSVPVLGTVSVAGLVVSSDNPAELCSARFENVSPVAHAPVASSNLRLWLRADTGVTSSSGSVTTWLDQSGTGNNAVQATSAYQPSIVDNVVGDKPVIRFNSTAKTYLTVPNNSSLSLDRVAVYAVVKRTSGTAAAVILEQFNANTAGYSLQASTGVGRAFRINGTVSSFSVPSPGQSFNVLSGTYDMVNRKLYVDGAEKATATFATAVGAKTNNLYIGSRVTTSPSVSFMGDIAEILIYSEVPSAKERLELDAYFYTKYGVGAQPALPLPNSDVASGTYPSSQTVTLSMPPEAEDALIYYTLSESAPLSEWSLYSTPLTISATSKLKAIAVKSGFSNSSELERTIAISPATNYVSRSGLALWFKADEGLSVAGGMVDSWTDQSGSGIQVLGTGTNRPLLTQATFSSGPRDVIRFASSEKDYLATATVPPITLEKLTVFAVTSTAASTGTQGVIIEKLHPSTSPVSGFSLQSTGASSRRLVIQGAQTVHTSANTTAFELLEGAYNRVNRTVRVDGGASTQVAQTSVLGNPARNLYIGGRTTTAPTSFDGDIAEILVYNKEFTSSTADQDEYRNIMAYFHDKYGIAFKPQARTPTISLNKQIFATAQEVEIINLEPGATIYYTLDGSTPTTGSTPYEGSFVVSQSSDVRAIAVKDRFENSSVLSYRVTIDPTTAYVNQSGLKVWLRADAGVMLSSSNTIARWNDQSGNGSDAVQGTEGRQPAAPILIGGQKWVNFNANDSEYLSIAHHAGLNSEAVSIFAIGVDSYLGTQSRYTIASRGTGSSTYALSYDQNGYGLQFLANGSTLAAQPAISQAQRSISGVRSSLASGKELFFNGKSLAWQAGVTLPNNLTADMLIGWGGASGTYMHGPIAEIFVYDRSITDDERRDLEAYAHMRYGLSCQPTSRTPEFAVSNASGGWGGKAVEIINHEPGSEIRYTTDGGEPTLDSALYVGPLTLARSTTIRAAAFKLGYIRSDLAVQTLLVNPEWTRTEIGSDPLDEQPYTATGNWSISTDGGGFNSSGDKLVFVSLPGIQGSGLDWSSSAPSAGMKGIMARASGEDDAAFVFLGFNSAGECRFVCRPFKGAPTLINRQFPGVVSGSQLRLRLVGNTVFTYTKSTGGSWVGGPGSDLYDPQGMEIGRGLKDSSGEAIVTYRLGAAFIATVQGTFTSHTLPDESLAYQVEQQQVRWHRLIEPKIGGSSGIWSRQGYNDGTPPSEWNSHGDAGMAGSDVAKADYVGSQGQVELYFNSIPLVSASSIDLYVRTASSSGTALPFTVFAGETAYRGALGEKNVDIALTANAWHYVGRIPVRTKHDNVASDTASIRYRSTSTNAGYLTLDGFMLVAAEPDLDANQNGIADGSSEDDYQLSTNGDFDGDGWSNYWSYLMNGDPLVVNPNNTVSRSVALSLAPGQDANVAVVAGQWLKMPLKFRATYASSTEPIPGYDLTVVNGFSSSTVYSETNPYPVSRMGMARSPEHLPQVQKINLVTDENGIASLWAFKPPTPERSDVYFYAMGQGYLGTAPSIRVLSYPNKAPGQISVQPEVADLRRVVEQSWPHSTPPATAYDVKGDLMAAGQPGIGVSFYRWNKSTGSWQQAEMLTAPAEYTASGFGSALKFVGDAPQYLVVESTGGLFIHQIVVNADEIDVTLSGFIETEPGQSFALAGDYIALGQPGHGDSGRVRIYKNVMGEWSLMETLTTSTAAPADQFGFSLCFSADGERLAVGAPGNPEWHLQTPSGSTPADPAVYVYKWDAGNESWEEEQKLDPEAPVAPAFGFGTRVCFLGGDTLAVGVPHAEADGSVLSSAGRIEVFKLSSVPDWERVASQEGDAPAFGADFVVSGNRFFVNVAAPIGLGAGSPLFDDAHLAQLLWDPVAETLTETRLLRFPEDQIIQLVADGDALFLLHDGFFEQYEMLPSVNFDASAGTVAATLNFNDEDLDWPEVNLLKYDYVVPPISVEESLATAVESIAPPSAQSPWALETPVTNSEKSRQLVVESPIKLQALRGEVSWLNFQVTDHAGLSDFETVGISIADVPPQTPASFQAQLGGNSLINLTWSSPEKAPAGYVVERAPLGDYQTAVSNSTDLNLVFRKVARPQGSDFAYGDLASTNSEGYAYRLKSWNGSGYSSYTTPLVIDLFAGAHDWPDWWEAAYGGGLLPGADEDGDGWTNLQEFQNGTNPLVADTDGDGQSDSEDDDPLNASRATVRHVLHTELVQ